MNEGPKIPLCNHCPQLRSNADEQTRIELRDQAGELMYGPDISIQPSDVGGILMRENEGISQSTAYFVLDCLGKISRNNCGTCSVGKTETDFGIIHRPRSPHS